MPNRNYLAGVKVERDLIKLYKKHGWNAVRTAGSHGEFDVIGYKPFYKVQLVQCKRITAEKQVQPLLNKFRKKHKHSDTYDQVLHIIVKGTTIPRQAIV